MKWDPRRGTNLHEGGLGETTKWYERFDDRIDDFSVNLYRLDTQEISEVPLPTSPEYCADRAGHFAVLTRVPGAIRATASPRAAPSSCHQCAAGVPARTPWSTRGTNGVHSFDQPLLSQFLQMLVVQGICDGQGLLMEPIVSGLVSADEKIGRSPRVEDEEDPQRPAAALHAQLAHSPVT